MMHDATENGRRPEGWTRRGGVWVRETESQSLLVPQTRTSFLRDFHYSVNPLAGCPFACRDCYVADLGAVRFRRERLPDGSVTNAAAAWGRWVEVRVRSADVLHRALRRGTLYGARLFMSPLSDVYWPGEREEGLTCRLLQLLAEHPVFDWLLLSTRSDLVTRDADVLRHLGDRVEVGVSVPSDREDVKRALAPRHPSIACRFDAVRTLAASGIPTRVHVAPLAPHTPDFPARLADVAPWIWLDWHAHHAIGYGEAFVARGWRPSTPDDVARFADGLRARMGDARVRVGQPHFADRWAAIRAPSR